MKLDGYNNSIFFLFCIYLCIYLYMCINKIGYTKIVYIYLY